MSTDKDFNIKVNPANIPQELHFLIPYAEKWGISDSDRLRKLLQTASMEELEELHNVVRPVLKDIVKASYFPPMEYTEEVVILSALMMASGGASITLEERRQQHEKSEQTDLPDEEVIRPPVKNLAERKAQLIVEGWPSNFPNPRVNPANVPEELHILIPYAEKWGISDRRLQESLFKEASIQEVEEMYQTLYPLWDNIWKFRTLEVSPEEPRSYEIGIFDAFSMIFSDAFNILKKQRPKRLLEIIGWPERWPGPNLNAAKLPLELQSLVPFANIWANDEQSLRDFLFKLSTTEELEEFMAIVKKIGLEKISHAAIKITYDETLEQAGYVILMLLDLVDYIEDELRNRSK